MVYRRVLEWPDKSLKVSSETYDFDNEDLIDTFRIVGGYGLSSPQIGLKKRVIIINEKLLKQDENLREELVMVNPVIKEKKGLKSFKESCFSLPFVSLDVQRSSEVKVSWINENGEEESKWFKGYASACIQHEIDHLDGILTIDRISSLRRRMIIKKIKKRNILSSKLKDATPEERSKSKSLATRKKNRLKRKKKK